MSLEHSAEKEETTNYFALALLMPETEYRRVLELHTRENKVDTKAVADHFQVTVSMAHRRGVDLGLLRQW